MKRRHVVAGVLTAAGLAAVAACSFPEIGYDDSTDSGAETSAIDSQIGDGGPPTDSSKSDAFVDGSLLPETAPPIDATSDPPDTGPCTDPCDCDKDGFKAMDAGCGGNDCDDNDNRAYPGEPNYLGELATLTTKGDWNCNKTVERVITNVGLSCGSMLTCANGIEGLKDDIPCGATGTYVYCGPALIGLGCVQVDSGLRQQECR